MKRRGYCFTCKGERAPWWIHKLYHPTHQVVER